MHAVITKTGADHQKSREENQHLGTSKLEDAVYDALKYAHKDMKSLTLENLCGCSGVRDFMSMPTQAAMQTFNSSTTAHTTSWNIKAQGSSDVNLRSYLNHNFFPILRLWLHWRWIAVARWHLTNGPARWAPRPCQSGPPLGPTAPKDLMATATHRKGKITHCLAPSGKSCSTQKGCCWPVKSPNCTVLEAGRALQRSVCSICPGLIPIPRREGLALFSSFPQTYFFEEKNQIQW